MTMKASVLVSGRGIGTVARRMLRVAVAAVGAVTLLLASGHDVRADDEDSGPAPVAVLASVPTGPVYTPYFRWSVQLADGSGIGGMSADLPSAVDAAQQGIFMTDEER